MLDGEKQVEIKSASLKDSLCNYTYELLQGVSRGDVVNRKGAHIVHDDLPEAFKKLNVHLAHLDDAYNWFNDKKHSLEDLKEASETENYEVTSLRISGVEENKSIILSGHKKVSNGYISFDTPKVKFESDYRFAEDLFAAVDEVISEVEQYMNGKKQPEPVQTTMEFISSGSVEDFAEAEV